MTILERLTKIEERSTVSSASPLKLTDLGESVADRAGVHIWASIEADRLIEQVAALADGKPYLVDEFCESHVKSLGDPYETIMKECTYEFGITAAAVRAVFRIVLRDALLERLGLVEA